MDHLQSEGDIANLLNVDGFLRNNLNVKSASSSNIHQFENIGEGLTVATERSDSGIGSHKELSRSLDYLDIDPMLSSGDGMKGLRERRKSQTLPNYPSPNLRQFKKLSLGSAFGTKHLGLGRKFSSLIASPSERYQITLGCFLY